MKKLEKKDILDCLHILLSTASIGFYAQMGMRNKESFLYWMFLGFMVFEAVFSYMYTLKLEYLMRTHLLYQMVSFTFPCVFVYLSIWSCFDAATVNKFLDSFHLVQLKVFIENHTIIWSVVLFIMWTSRIVLTRKFVIDASANHHIRDPKATVENMTIGDFNNLRILLNFTVVIFFSIMAYYNDKNMERVYIWLAIFELCMNQPCSILLFRLHLIYQSVLFSVPIFLTCVVYFHAFFPVCVTLFLESYGLEEVSVYASKGSVIVTLVIFCFWFLRLLDLESTLILFDTKTRIKEIKKIHQPLIQP